LEKNEIICSGNIKAPTANAVLDSTTIISVKPIVRCMPFVSLSPKYCATKIALPEHIPTIINIKRKKN
jgi:hypothetical protein